MLVADEMHAAEHGIHCGCIHCIQDTPFWFDDDGPIAKLSTIVGESCIDHSDPVGSYRWHRR